MPARLAFEHQIIYGDSEEGIRLPTILSYGGKAVWTDACVDTGSKYCVFRYEIGRELGVEIESGIPLLMGPASGGSVETFGHEVILQTHNVAFDAVVYFARYPGLRRNLLGRVGWLRSIRIAINDYDGVLHYSTYDE
ncbi:MAG: hypothetical protein SFV23_19455 [Planctomycetaceae bacterium]|nr:hypothetical protein [Planctomycetaceae bacterium]